MADVLVLLQGQDITRGLADAAAAGAVALGVEGLAVGLTTEDGGIELLACSDETARTFQDLQFTLGQGPGPDAVRDGVMVWVPDLARIRHDRWPALTMEAPDQGARAVFCFPIGIGAIRLGVLTAVRRTPGPLTAQQADDALLLTSALTARCLAAAETSHNSTDSMASPDSLQHSVIHQATGMTSVQLGVTLPQALLRMRAHAYSSGSSITEISKDIVDRRLRLDPNGGGTPGPVADKDGSP